MQQRIALSNDVRTTQHFRNTEIHIDYSLSGLAEVIALQSKTFDEKRPAAVEESQSVRGARKYRASATASDRDQEHARERTPSGRCSGQCRLFWRESRRYKAAAYDGVRRHLRTHESQDGGAVRDRWR